VLAIGVNEYPHLPVTNHLDYPVPDARAVVDSLRRGGSAIFDSVHVVTLYDAVATRRAILDTLGALARTVGAEDVFLLFYAGHGTVQRDTFHLALGAVRDLRSRAQLARAGSDEHRLRRRLEAIPALKKILVLDACRSGAVLARGLASRATRPGTATADERAGDVDATVARGGSAGGAELADPASVLALSPEGQAQQRAVAQLARSGGVVVISATAPRQLAVEVAQVTHGVFTYALLRALAADGTPRVRTVRGIMVQVEQEVPDLAMRYGRRRQYPMLWSYGQDFPLVLR
jgi:uncharacterized caspase-like protein